VDRQKDLAVKLKKYIKSNGLKQVFVAEQVNLCPSLLSRFLNQKKELWTESLDRIEQWLLEHQN
jgi:hypothetical protein